MKIFKQVLTSLFLIVFAMSLVACSKGGSVQYGEPTSFQKGESIDFPDFTLTYMGGRVEDIPTSLGNSFPFSYDDFEITSGDQKQLLSWSSGIGDIGPTLFEINNEEYYLERKMSDFIDLDDGQLVIWERQEYQRLIEEG